MTTYFSAQSALQQKKLSEQINMVMKKASGRLTAGMLANYEESVKHFLSNDQGFLFMNQINEIPEYCKRFQGEVLAMVKQFGCPTLFLTLSSADLRWNELVEVISNLNSLGLNHKDTEVLNYFERCNVFNSNTVLLDRHSQYRVKIFFKKILLIRSEPLGKLKYYAIRVELQFRGLSHIHRFLWILNTLTLSEKSLDDYVEFLDSVLCGNLLSEEGDLHFHHLVKTFQMHCHSKTCHKYGRLFTAKTIVT